VVEAGHIVEREQEAVAAVVEQHHFGSVGAQAEQHLGRALDREDHGRIAVAGLVVRVFDETLHRRMVGENHH